LKRSAARMEARLKTVVGLPSLVMQSDSIARTSRVVPAVVTVNSTTQKPSIPRDAALLGYSGATLTIGRYSPSPEKPVPMFTDTLASNEGAAMLSPLRFAVGTSKVGSGISGGGASGSSGFSGLASSKRVSISYLGIRISAIL